MTPKPGDITEAEYVELPKRFNLEKFDARALVELARSAGQQMVFTTKHHDGFCMFDLCRDFRRTFSRRGVQ